MYLYGLYKYVLVDPDMANTVLLKTVYANPKQLNDTSIVGKNKVILTFISNKSLNGTGFKVKAKLRMLNYLHQLYFICKSRGN